MVMPIPEMAIARCSIPVDTCFLWKLKIFEYFNLSCLLIVVGLGSAERFGSFFSILKALCKVSSCAGNFITGIFVLFAIFTAKVNRS